MIADDVIDWARRTPDKIALSHNGKDISYRKLAYYIRCVRTHLIERRVEGPGVAVLAAPSLVDFWCVSLAARSLGLTTSATPTASLIEDARLGPVRYVISINPKKFPGIEQKCAALGLKLVVLTPGPPADVAEPAPVPPGGHILRTSGTTGSFKMVLMEPAFEDEYHAHRNAVLGIDSDTVFQSFNFAPWTGIGYKTPAGVWKAGGTMLLHEEGSLAGALRDTRATHGAMLPDTLNLVLAAPEDSFPCNEGLKMSLTGGAVSAAQFEAARRRITPNLFNRLSSTEASIIGFTALESAEDRRWHRIAPGRVVEVVGADDRPLPPGEEGRVRVRLEAGPRGYFNHPQATREFFRDGYFYTGDLGMFRPDGRLALNGRVTDIINVRGRKVSPAPIEDRLKDALQLPGICLFSMQDEGGEERLHVVVESKSGPDEERLLPLIKAELQVPDPVIHNVEALPRTATGKLERAAVRALVIAGA